MWSGSRGIPVPRRSDSTKRRRELAIAGRFSGRVPTLVWRSWESVRGELEGFLRKLNDGNNASQETPDTPTTVQAGVAADPGDSLPPALSNHTHPAETAAPSNPVALGGASAEGTGTALMRADATLVLDDGGATPGQVLEWDGSAWVPTTPSSGGANTVRVTAAFGASFTDKAQTVVTGEAWVGAASCLSGLVVTPAGVDPDEIRLLDFQVVISDLVAGDGFTVTVYSEPEAKGDYEVMVIGA